MENQPLVAIERFDTGTASHAAIAELDDIFFSASSTQQFASEQARSEFRERWLGSYLSSDKDDTFVAVTGTGRIVGYLVGSLRDPAHDPRHAALGYFTAFAPMTGRYPAHLHINVASQYRSAGVGARLIEAFAAHAASRGAPGMHVVTGKGMRNVGFYLRNGFALVGEAGWNGRTVVMLARSLSPLSPGGNLLS